MTSPKRWDPWQELDQLRRQIDELHDSFLRRVGQSERLPPPDFVPEADLVETAETLRVYVSLPGTVEEDIEVHLDRGSLTISGYRQPPFDPAATFPRVREGRYGHFRRTLSLPSAVDPTSVRATLSDGVLTIFLTRQKALG
ncbi:MAG: molecular chaperone [Pirellulaceae bacterium]|nr:MAG: molecular chaperone [Pirellulaceae bacterium]